jgi:trehalose synthase
VTTHRSTTILTTTIDSIPAQPSWLGSSNLSTGCVEARGAPTQLRDVEVTPLDPVRLRPVIGKERHARLQRRADDFQLRLGGAKVWNLNSTASGGGVAEMLQVLVGYTQGVGLDVSWLVIQGDPLFFSITKRLHNRIHGAPGDSGQLGVIEAAHYRTVTQANARALLPRVRPGDVVILHDPQTAGMAAILSEAGLRVVWRCHIGADQANRWTEEAWTFLRPHIDAAAAVVFSRTTYVPPGVPASKVAVIPPSIDPLSPKNRNLPGPAQQQILERIGLFGSPTKKETTFCHREGSPDKMVLTASIVADGPPLDSSTPLVVQVSRWDRLKDMQGVMHGFASSIAGRMEADLALVGPAVEGVGDDPEGAEVLSECIAEWEQLPPEIRQHIRLITLPMQDIDQNALMVNAIQSHATVIVQKSLVEGFGLTVAEGMWKAKPVVASAVGGIIDQITPDTGVLLDDPTNLEAFGGALYSLLTHPGRMEQMGQAARRHVFNNFIGDLHLLRYAQLIGELLSR